MSDAVVLHRCSECGRAVAVVDEQLIRACPHVDAPVVGQMSAVMKGDGGLKAS